MLSVVITAWNEAKTLPRVVASVRQLADEIVVVVDRASTDKTLEVAKNLGCKTFSHDHTGIVEPMRNFSISRAKGDWILLLDADEEVPQSLRSKIQDLISKPEADFYRIPRKNIIFGKWIKSNHWWPDYVYRLFKKGHITWDDTIHSLPFTRGVGVDLKANADQAIVHHHYESITQYVERFNRYTDYLVIKLKNEGYSFSGLNLVTKPLDEFIRHYFARGGYKDGIHGLALALLQTCSEAVLYLKVWQAEQFLDTAVNPEQVTKTVAAKQSEWHWWRYQAKIDSSNFLVKWWYKLLRKVGV